ncbi:MAG: FAD-dependent oxidoreductase [Candidatus Dojkabacteria bacterium]|jgi:thioredoxin reductase (NADPH)|nr:FAD-dependent oxidoreductase [Candidatus Dojkabacteria bacterium]MDD2270452.1 FAD-dependent oxidoreductase [Candidatus Dojkabacteria bacterium]
MYDIAIVGSGPAGYSAGIYASRYQLKTIIFGKMVGGTTSEAHKICNYPGFPEITGLDLSVKMYEHAKELGCEMKFESVTNAEKIDDYFKITTDIGTEYTAKTVLLTIGTERTKLSIPDEDKFLGKGLSYCATCDANFYRDKIVGVIGGSSAATMASMMLSDIAKKVYIIYRGNELRGDPAWKKQVLANEKIEVLYNTVIIGLEGGERLQSLKLNRDYGGSNILPVDGVFIEIGSEPNKNLPEKIALKTDKKGYIVVDHEQKTSIEGIWAAGDCTTNSNEFRQVITAVSEGGIAANDIYKYLNS